MRAISASMVAATLLLLGACGGSEADPEAAASPTGPDLSTNAAVCRFVIETPREKSDTELLWAQVNRGGAALEEVLAIGWAPGVFNSEADGDQLRAEQFYNTLPVAQEVVRLRPGIDLVSVAFTGTNLESSFKTTFLLPASVVLDYVDTPEGRNAVQGRVEVTADLPPSSGPNGLEVTDADGLLRPQC
jgi:hypothetical protein